MFQHVRAIVLYVVLTLVICCFLYPLVTLAIARVFFPNQAEGSLIDEKGRPVTNPAKAVGSRLIAQPFSSDEYFQPRPSATSPSYNAAASGATNWGANNVLLRDRVARALGPIVKYAGGTKKGQPVGPDVEAWLQKELVGGKDLGIASRWAKHYPTLAQNWVKGDPLFGDPEKGYVSAWMKSHPDAVAKWKSDHPDSNDPQPSDLAKPFFDSFSKDNPGAWPSIQDQPAADGTTEKVVKPVNKGADVQSYLFEMWLQEHPGAILENVPADMVMASGSGLDPHITLKNALYQIDRVAGKWAEKSKKDPAQVQGEIEQLLNEKSAAPLGGLVGVKLVNVLEVNLALRARYGS